MTVTLIHSRKIDLLCSVFLFIAGSLAWTLIGSVRAAPVHYLPHVHSLSAERSFLGRDVRLHAYHAGGKDGRILDVPAYLLDVPSGAGGWISPSPDTVPAFPEPLPRRMLDKTQLFYSGGKGSSGLWLVVPRNWVVWSAAYGGDGSSRIQFIPASGRGSGWMQVSGQSGCYGCMPEVVAGLGIPAAERAFKDNEFFPLNAKLWPKPSVLIHPDACTALLTYRTNESTVHGAVLVYVDADGQAEATESLYISLPDNESKLGQFIATTFLKSRIQLTHYHCHVPRLR